MSGSIFSGFGNLASFVEREPRLSLYGHSLPWVAVVLLYQAAILFFVFLAARRKLDSERLHSLSKPQAAAAMATLGVLLLGSIWDLADALDLLAIVALYIMVVVAILLSVMITPTQAEYSKGLWRAGKEGRSRLSLWDDLALNRTCLAVLGAIILITCTLVWNRFASAGALLPAPIRQGYPLAIANAVLAVASFGLAHQFFELRFGRRGLNLFALFLFLTWVVPLVVGTILLFASYMDPAPAQIVFALSPIVGLGLSSGGSGGGEHLMAIEAAAITPNLLFTFVFNGLVTASRRRVRRSVLLGIEKQQQPGGGEEAPISSSADHRAV
jgi:hypothetical protein